MSDFVEQCRREWKRLGVADPFAEEMAADLASDLSEAAAEGISIQELLGNAAFDPRAFAASWAAERGIIPAPPGPDDAGRRPLALVTFTSFAVITLIVAALLLLTGEPKLSLAASTQVTKGSRLVSPPPGTILRPGRVEKTPPVSAAAPIEWILLVVAIVALGFAAWLWSRSGRSRLPVAPV